jgi:hypothetical protein
MPDNFHFLLYTTNDSVQPLPDSKIPSQYLTEGIRLLLSSYTKGFNKERSLTGNLFQQKTRAVCLTNFSGESPLIKSCSSTAFYYIHQHPLRSDLVAKIEDWEFSSFRDYLGLRKGNLCSISQASQYVRLNLETFYEDSYTSLPHDELQLIF